MTVAARFQALFKGEPTSPTFANLGIVVSCGRPCIDGWGTLTYR
jgi:hypothetical protein